MKANKELGKYSQCMVKDYLPYIKNIIKQKAQEIPQQKKQTQVRKKK